MSHSHIPIFEFFFLLSNFFYKNRIQSKNKIENPGAGTNQKSQACTFLCPISFALFAFVVSCFGTFGPIAARCIFFLADLEMRQHESLLASQGLSPMDPSARSQFLIYLCPSSFPLMLLLGIALDRQILSLLLFLSPMLPPLAPSPLLRPYPLPLPLLRNSSLFLDALSFLLSRGLLAFALS